MLWQKNDILYYIDNNHLSYYGLKLLAENFQRWFEKHTKALD